MTWPLAAVIIVAIIVGAFVILGIAGIIANTVKKTRTTRPPAIFKEPEWTDRRG